MGFFHCLCYRSTQLEQLDFNGCEPDTVPRLKLIRVVMNTETIVIHSLCFHEYYIILVNTRLLFIYFLMKRKCGIRKDILVCEEKNLNIRENSTGVIKRCCQIYGLRKSCH